MDRHLSSSEINQKNFSQCRGNIAVAAKNSMPPKLCRLLYAVIANSAAYTLPPAPAPTPAPCRGRGRGHGQAAPASGPDAAPGPAPAPESGS